MTRVLVVEHAPDYAIPSPEELNALPERLVRELDWSMFLHRYQTHGEIVEAAEAGILTEFTNTADIARVHRYDDPDVPAWSRTPYLSPSAHGALDQLSVYWRSILDEEYGLEVPEVRLAITSMTRSQEYQEHLVQSGRLAWPDSTHCTGHTFDVDNSGYYLQISGKMMPVIDQRRPVTEQYTRRNMLPGYDSRITEAAMLAARVLHGEGVINVVEEFSGTSNAGLHIAARPDLAA